MKKYIRNTFGELYNSSDLVYDEKKQVYRDSLYNDLFPEDCVLLESDNILDLIQVGDLITGDDNSPVMQVLEILEDKYIVFNTNDHSFYFNADQITQIFTRRAGKFVLVWEKNQGIFHNIK